jgi:hypothetical protein
MQVLQASKIIDAELVFSDDAGSQIAVSGGTNHSRIIDFEFIRPKESARVG